MLRGPAPLLLGIALLACAGEPRSEAPSPASPRVAAERTAAPGPAWSLDDADGCGTDTTDRHPDPVVLVYEMVRRDGAGDFIGGETANWLGGALLCPDHLGGPDAFYPIDTMRVLTADAVIRADTAWVPVRYVQLGEADMRMFMPERKRDFVDTFVVARTAHGWRVASHGMPMRIRASVATGWEGMSDSIRTMIRAAAAASRAAGSR